jgi:hypothetical protein
MNTFMVRQLRRWKVNRHMIMVVALNATGDMLPVADATSCELVTSRKNFTQKAFFKPSRGQH